jgi:O-antigen ligase
VGRRAAGILAMTLASRQPGRRLVRLVLPTLGVLLIVAISPWGEKLLDFLPFVGSIDSSNVAYRQQLFEVSVKVISMSPWFGSPYFAYSAPMQELRVGNLIDVVNTYLLVALRYGYVGMTLFCAIFAVALGSVVAALRRQLDEGTERFNQGQAIFGMLVAVLVTIATVSDISFIPFLYWCAAGLAVGYARLVAGETVVERSPHRVLHWTVS